MINTFNEWDNLKSVIVGIANNAKIPSITKDIRTVNFADVDNINTIKTGRYPKQVIEEANQDLEIFCEFLKKEGIDVKRPIDNDPNYYNYCPRDSVLTFRNQSLATPMPLKARNQEYKSFEHHLENLETFECSYSENLYNTNCIGNPEVLALNETEPSFDAANILKANDKLLYLVSNSGNKKGAQLLQEKLKVDVKPLENVYSYMHIDSTICFLDEGLMLLNPSRIKSKDQLPFPFNKWQAIWCPEPVDIGYYPRYNNASPWINMNLLSLNTKQVVLEENQHPLRKELEKHGFECAMLPMRHQRTLGGGFHCVTLDLIRES